MAARTSSRLPGELQDALLAALDAEAEWRSEAGPQRVAQSKYILDRARDVLEAWRVGSVTTGEAVCALQEAVELHRSSSAPPGDR